MSDNPVLPRSADHIDQDCESPAPLPADVGAVFGLPDVRNKQELAQRFRDSGWVPVEADVPTVAKPEK
jgi:hypothetical protein